MRLLRFGWRAAGNHLPLGIGQAFSHGPHCGQDRPRVANRAGEERREGPRAAMTSGSLLQRCPQTAADDGTRNNLGFSTGARRALALNSGEFSYGFAPRGSSIRQNSAFERSGRQRPLAAAR